MRDTEEKNTLQYIWMQVSSILLEKHIHVNGGFVLINNSSTQQLLISSLLLLLPQRLLPRLLPSVSPHALGETPRTLLVTG